MKTKIIIIGLNTDLKPIHHLNEVKRFDYLWQREHFALYLLPESNKYIKT